MLKGSGSLIGRVVNLPLSILRLKVVRLSHDWSDPTQYIPFRETIDGARTAGMSVGDYIDAVHQRPGVTQQTIDQMKALGVFRQKIERICEIGPGSGRYLEKVQRISTPSHYEIYETATDWARYLVESFAVVLMPTDGKSLSHTASQSICLVQAHKVFAVTPFLTTCSYFAEMARVVRKGGKVVFDVMTEECVNYSILENWINSRATISIYPTLIPKQFAINFFTDRGFRLDGSFRAPMGLAESECFVFTRESL